jgi:hypothetical protein
MTRPEPDVVSEDPRSSASRNGFAKHSLMYQTARGASEAVSDDPRSSASQDAFEKVLAVSLKDLVMRTEVELILGRVEQFH